MTSSSSSILAPMFDKLQLWMELDDEDRDAVLALPHKIREMRAHEFIVRDGDETRHSCLLISGFVIRHKIAGNGGRQILSIHMKGDIIDLQNSLLGSADHNVQALTKIKTAMIPVAAIERLAINRPLVGRAMWNDTLVDAAIFREWTLNIGRRDARTRTAHMLCEFALRLDVAGLGEQHDYELPMTQEQFADSVALTPVHVNRTLKGLDNDGLIIRTQRSVKIPDWKKLAQVADFDPRYLHLKRLEPFGV